VDETPVRDFAAIRLDQDYTVDAAVYSVNLDYTTDGETSRRDGMKLAQSQSGLSFASFNSVTAGPQVVFATSTGTLVALSAT
jgi:hypothetical protein